MPTIDTMETLAFSRWDSSARTELKRFARRTDIKIVDIRRQRNNLVVTFRRLGQASASEPGAEATHPFHP